MPAQMRAGTKKDSRKAAKIQWLAPPYQQMRAVNRLLAVIEADLIRVTGLPLRVVMAERARRAMFSAKPDRG